MIKQEYQKTIARLEEGEKLINGQWLSEDPVIQKWVRGYENLALLTLQYEIEKDLLPI